MPNIRIPSNTVLFCDLLENLLNAHKSKEAESPLSGLDWADTEAQLSALRAKHAEMEEARRTAERLREERDQIKRVLKELVRHARDILKGIHRGELRKLGEYGFTVDD